MLAASRVTSFSNSSKRQLSQPVNKHAEEALRSSFYFLCKEVSETADLAALLYTNELLSNSHLHEFIKKVEPGSLENMRMVYNIQLLRHVQSAISEDPGKFDALCATFDDLQLSHCSQRLRGQFSYHHEQGGGTCWQPLNMIRIHLVTPCPTSRFGRRFIIINIILVGLILSSNSLSISCTWNHNK